MLDFGADSSSHNNPSVEGQLPDQNLTLRRQFIDPDGAFAGPKISQGIAALEPQSVPS